MTHRIVKVALSFGLVVIAIVAHPAVTLAWTANWT
jgi:hypothetical protein